MRVRLAVCGGKGGCGKTTTALAIGRVLAEARRRPVVVDGDRDMPNLHVYADVPDDPGVDELADGRSLDAVTHPVDRLPGVRVVPGVPGCDVEGALAALGAQDPGAPIVLDSPAGASEDVAVPLRFADAALLVTTASGPCVRATVKTAAMARTLGAPPLGAVVSRSSRVPPALPEALGVPRDRFAAMPAAADPLAADARRSLGRLAAWVGPNA